jgi:hypothetical protein
MRAWEADARRTQHLNEVSLFLTSETSDVVAVDRDPSRLLVTWMGCGSVAR